MKTLSFDSFTKKIYIKAPLAELYRCWATADGICEWFLRRAEYRDNKGILRPEGEFFQVGDQYTWEWHNWDGKESGTVTEANGINRLGFSFAGVSNVEVTLEEHDRATLVVLRQYNIPTDEESRLNIHFGCSNGWTFWLANLKAYLEHGILLNETEFDLRKIPLAGLEFVNM